MKLKNKRTGEVIEPYEIYHDGQDKICVRRPGENFGVYIDYKYNSLAELNAEWEDAPEEPKEYWYIADNGEIEKDTDDGGAYEERMKEIGNYFETEEEAEKAVEKLKAWKRLRDKGISFEAKVIDRKWYLEPKAEPQQRTFDEAHDVFKDIMFIFGGEE